MPQSLRKSKRAPLLLGLACLSLAAKSTFGFTSRNAHTTTAPLHLAHQATPVSATSMRSPSHLHMVVACKKSSTPTSFPSLPLLTPEEEAELLREAVEARRIRKLEQEQQAMQTQGLSFLSVRAKAAGYGEDWESYEQAIVDGQRAREQLVTRNMGLVHYIVNQQLKQSSNKGRLNSLSAEDLVQEGAIGLARAVDKWNPAIGGKFSTYAVYWIRAAVLRCIAERDDVVRVPSHVSEAVSKINNAAGRLGLDVDSTFGRSGNWKRAQAAKQLAEEAGLSERNFEEAMKARSRRYTGGYVAFESWMQKGENLQADIPTLEEATEGLSDASSMGTAHLRDTLSQFLRPKEMEALSWRYGLVEDTSSQELTPAARAQSYLAQAEEELFGSSPMPSPASTSQRSGLEKKGRWGEAMTFTEVAKKMEVSTEYTRKLCHAALAKLREAAEDGRLEPALLF